MTIESPNASHLPSLCRLWREAFGDGDTFLNDFMREAFAPDRARVILENGEAVAALYWLDASLGGRPVAYLYAIATAKSHRGRGLCARLLADTHAQLSARGYAAALLVPSEPSLFGFYARFGYVPCAPMQMLSVAASDEPITLRRVGAEEYGRLRAALLPQGGVLQEGGALRFLETQAELFAGEDVLMAVRRESDGTLFGIELLGNAARAPQALCTLGVSHGSFRVAGGETPFAMLRALTDEPITPPTYFALAFD